MMLLTGRAVSFDDLACMSNVWWTAVKPVLSVVRGFIMYYHHTWTFLNHEDRHFKASASWWDVWFECKNMNTILLLGSSVYCDFLSSSCIQIGENFYFACLHLFPHIWFTSL